jgi:V/A-type H+-transporting ATPase subunit I
MYVFTVCTIIWGTLTGVFFGQGMWPSFKPLVPWLNDERHLQMFCFFIGATHLSIAHVWRAMIKMPSKTALSEAGWIAILWFMFFLAKSLILNQAMPFWAMYLLYTGMFLVVFYHQPGRSFFKTVGSGLGVLALSIVNMFTDVVSYIRLAAVGLASTAVADSFNQMAMGFGFKTLFSGIAVVLILLIGHALNLALGFMAIMVHGVRLNILEFSSHLGMEWSGVSYDPLRKIK